MAARCGRALSLHSGTHYTVPESCPVAGTSGEWCAAVVPGSTGARLAAAKGLCTQCALVAGPDPAQHKWLKILYNNNSPVVRTRHAQVI